MMTFWGVDQWQENLSLALFLTLTLTLSNEINKSFKTIIPLNFPVFSSGSDSESLVGLVFNVHFILIRVSRETSSENQ